ncbi:MAG: serine hydrolase domain-containing protein [Litorimonas sp.]
MLIKPFIVSLCFALCGLRLCAVPVNAQTLEATSAVAHNQVDTDYMDRRASELMQQLEMTGLSMAIVENGKITFAKGYGEALRDSGILVTEDTVFRWASVSKGVAANTVLSLAEDGHFNLNEKAEDLAPSLKLPPAPVRVNLFNLLSHQIGIVRNAYDNRIEGGDNAKNARANLNRLSYLCAPATCHTYQNVTYDASSEIIERMTGKPYARVVQERVFRPLKMTTASVTYEGLIRSKNWARPHGRFGQRISRVKPNYYRVPAAAGVNSSVKDLAKWMIAQMPDHSNFPDKRLAEMQAPRVQTPREQNFLNRRFEGLRNAHYGLGWRVYDYYGHKIVGHRGGVEGYRALTLFSPEKNAGIAVMWNSPHTRPIGLQMEFLDQLYGFAPQDRLDFGR